MHGQQPEISASVGARRQQPARPGPRTNSVSHQEFWNLSRSKSTTRICSCGFSFAEHAAHGVDHHDAFVLFLQRDTVPCLHLSRCTTRLSLQFRVTSAKTWRSCALLCVYEGGIREAITTLAQLAEPRAEHCLHMWQYRLAPASPELVTAAEAARATRVRVISRGGRPSRPSILVTRIFGST